MVDSIKITALQNIGANIAYTTLVPVVNMAGTPTTQKANLQNLGNLILNGAGGSYFAPAARAISSQVVTNAAQPNITSVGTLTSLTVTGNITTGNINGGNIVVANFYYGDGRFLTNVVANGTYSNSNVVSLMAAFGSNTITTTGNITSGNINIPNGYANVTGTANTVGGGATVGVRSILAIDSAFGSNSSADPASAQAVRGRVTGSNLTKTRNYVAGVTGQYLVTGTNASEFINTGLLGVVGDQTTTANAAVVAYLDGDGGLTTAGSAYGVSMKNSTPGSGFDYGLDLQFIDLNVAGTTTPFKQADIRFNNGVELVANTANNISINADVTVGNITATNLGNIATINLTGSNANVLYGNGVFAPVSGAGGLPLANGNSNFNIATANGNATVTTAGTRTWTFGTDGSLTLPIGVSIDYNGNVQYPKIIADSGKLFSVQGQGNTGSAALAWTIDPNAASQYAAVAVTRAGGDDLAKVILTAQANSGDSANAKTWTFNEAGNLTLPGNTFAVNYANGTQVSIGGGGANTGNVTFDDNIVIGTGDEFGSTGLFLAPGNGSIANSAVQYLRVRGGDVATHIHLDTGNNQFYDQYFGDDAKYVKLELGDAGNVVIGTDDANGNQYNWSFTSDGNLILADGNSIITSVANSSLDPLNPNVSTMVFTPDQNYTSQSLVIDPTGPSHIHLRAPGANIDEPDANIFLGGETSSFEVGYYNGNAPNVYIHSNNNTWTFDNGGTLLFPRDTDPNTADPILAIVGGANPSISSIDASLAGPANLGISALTTIFSGVSGDEIKIYPDDGEIGSTGNLQIWANSGGNTEYSWTFDTTGNLTLPLGSIVYETNIPDGALSGSAIALKPIGGTTANQQLLIYPTAADGDHIHMTSGNLYATELFLGSDNLYVKLANTGNVVINSNDGNSNTAMWTFDTDGNLTLPGNLVINGLTNVFGSNVALLQSNPDLPLLSVSSGSNGGVSSLWVEDIGNVGTSNIAAVYANPTSGSGIVRIAVGQNGGNTGPNLWDFGATGNLTLPGNTFAVNYANGTAVTIPTVGNIASINLDGSNSNVLYGNGIFGPVTNPLIAGAPGSGTAISQANAPIGIETTGSGTIQLGWVPYTASPPPGELASVLINAPWSGSGNSNVQILTGNIFGLDPSQTAHFWTFGNDGNLTLPHNTFSINYANGTQVSLGGSSSNISNGNSNVSIATANGNVTIAAVGNTTMTVTGTGANVTGTLTSTGKIGYASGSTVTQATNRGTGVTINAIAGTIITTSAAMVATEIDTFSVTNSSVDPNNDIVLAQIVSPNQGTYNCIANPAVIGGFNPGFFLNIVNISGFTTSDETITIRFMVIKAPNA